jgi:hypothetical protein
VGDYQGDPGEAFWFFDRELAQATEKYQASYRGLKPQLAGYLQGGKMVAQKNDHLQVELKFEPQADGVTFKIAGAFYDTVPEGSPRLPQWTGLPAGSPLGHATNAGPVLISAICGPVEKLAPDTFALRLQRDTIGKETRYELVFAATHPGNAEYKPAVQQAHLFVPARNRDGADQRITFPKIPNQKAGTKSLKLSATSDANVPVYYYVREGPAEIDGDTLKFTSIPPCAKFPVKVTVVAWQYGRPIEPKLKTAEPVEQSIMIEK